jgi:SpoVK/Ycf46/Vps4 family AAA+-type ATPase
MDNLDLNTIFQRTEIETEIVSILKDFDKTSQNHMKKGFYIYGTPGCGKSLFVTKLLKRLDYDVILYDAGDVRNKSLFQNIDSNHISNHNVLNLMRNQRKKIAIVMDEIDGMNNGDKGGIDALIKLIRQKKTKKQKSENTTLNPIFCIGNHESDKKIRELMKACYTFELKTPTHSQMTTILKTTLPVFPDFTLDFQQDILTYIQGDLRKLLFVLNLYRKKPELLTSHAIKDIFQVKIFNKDAKKNTWKLLCDKIPLKDHNIFMNETDRTTVALLWHENIVKPLSQFPVEKTFPFYGEVLQNICFADYIGRITFQSQIWQFNEMASLIKTFYNNKMYHERFDQLHKPLELEDIEFTKVLTKYSTEYNNQLFLHGLCQKMNMEKKDCIAFFQELRLNFGAQFFNHPEKMMFVEYHLGKEEIDTLDIKRMYRFLDKNVKKDDTVIILKEEEDELSLDSED